MTALDHELTSAQVALFHKTGRLLEVAESVKQERENYLRLLKEVAEQRRQEVTTNER